MTLSRGIYHIENAGVPVAIDLYNGSSADGTAIKGWSFGDGTKLNWNQLWLVEPVAGKTDTFTVRSLIAGSYMDLAGGSSDNQTPITGSQRTGTNQEWIIKYSADNKSYKMMNSASGTFADLYNGGSLDGTPIYGWQGDFNNNQPHQCWFFKRMSLSSAQVNAVIKNNPHLSTQYKGYQTDGEYLILPPYLWQEIWNTTGLSKGNKKWRREIFDCDDFALVMKSAIAEWGAEKWRADGFAVFCGLMLGTKPGAAHAYNFTISDDYTKVVFFEPQTNKFMDDIGCNAYLAYF
uniref:Lectin n=1 Tax=Polyporus umbellatus TaxID=158314 RepID=A0A160HLE2_9APHY|nr:lectin [Polyporus umbellatus]